MFYICPMDEEVYLRDPSKCVSDLATERDLTDGEATFDEVSIDLTGIGYEPPNLSIWD